MLSTFLRPKQRQRRSSSRTFLFKGFQAFRNATPSAEDTDEEEGEEHEQEEYNEDEDEQMDDDEDDEEQPILPIFSAPLLGLSMSIWTPAHC